MTKFLDRVARTIDGLGMAAPGERVLAAVSGGPDSMAMLHALDELSGRLGISLAVAHMDHGLRDESSEDAAFVERAAAGLGLECVTKRADPGSLKGPGINTQSAAREARYAFLEETAEALGAKRVAFAHTMDDQAETFVMRLLRGSGTRGLASIPPVRGMFVRPLIDVSRAEVMDYLDSRGIAYRTDPTNLTTDYLRNRIRLELMPALEGYNPNVVRTLAGNAMLLRDEDSFMDTLAGEAMRGLVRGERGWLVYLEREGLSRMHPALARRVVRQVLGRLAGGLSGIGQGHIEDALALVRTGATGKGVDLPGGLRAELSYEDALFYRPEAAPEEFCARLDVPGSVELPELGITIEAGIAGDDGPPPSADCAYFDAAKAAGPLTVRSRKPGDFFYPAGMQGRKKLKEYFIDAKVPRLVRDSAPVVESGAGIIWVAGYRTDARFAVAPARGALMLRVRKSVSA